MNFDNLYASNPSEMSDIAERIKEHLKLSYPLWIILNIILPRYIFFDVNISL